MKYSQEVLNLIDAAQKLIGGASTCYEQQVNGEFPTAYVNAKDVEALRVASMRVSESSDDANQLRDKIRQFVEKMKSCVGNKAVFDYDDVLLLKLTSED
jgi:hypothetical protein